MGSACATSLEAFLHSCTQMLMPPSLGVFFYFFPPEVCQQEAVAKQCHNVHLPFSLLLAALGWR